MYLQNTEYAIIPMHSIVFAVYSFFFKFHFLCTLHTCVSGEMFLRLYAQKEVTNTL